MPLSHSGDVGANPAGGTIEESFEEWLLRKERQQRERLDHRRPKFDLGVGKGGGWCRLCGEPVLTKDGVPNRRRTWHRGEPWETRNCKDEYWLAISSSYAKHRVWERDRGKCSSCDIQCEDWPQSYTWEADHVVPLIDGGSFGLDNLQTLCVDCHKAKTAKEAAERAVRRKAGRR